MAREVYLCLFILGGTCLHVFVLRLKRLYFSEGPASTHLPEIVQVKQIAGGWKYAQAHGLEAGGMGYRSPCN